MTSQKKKSDLRHTDCEGEVKVFETSRKGSVTVECDKCHYSDVLSIEEEVQTKEHAHELYWSFRDLIHNGHIGKTDENSLCITCNKIHDIEVVIARIIGVDKYYPNPSLSQSQNSIGDEERSEDACTGLRGEKSSTQTIQKPLDVMPVVDSRKDGTYTEEDFFSFARCMNHDYEIKVSSCNCYIGKPALMLADFKRLVFLAQPSSNIEGLKEELRVNKIKLNNALGLIAEKFKVRSERTSNSSFISIAEVIECLDKHKGCSNGNCEYAESTGWNCLDIIEIEFRELLSQSRSEVQSKVLGVGEKQAQPTCPDCQAIDKPKCVQVHHIRKAIEEMENDLGNQFDKTGQYSPYILINVLKKKMGDSQYSNPTLAARIPSAQGSSSAHENDEPVQKPCEEQMTYPYWYSRLRGVGFTDEEVMKLFSLSQTGTYYTKEFVNEQIAFLIRLNVLYFEPEATKCLETLKYRLEQFSLSQPQEVKAEVQVSSPVRAGDTGELSESGQARFIAVDADKDGKHTPRERKKHMYSAKDYKDRSINYPFCAPKVGVPRLATTSDWSLVTCKNCLRLRSK